MDPQQIKSLGKIKSSTFKIDFLEVMLYAEILVVNSNIDRLHVPLRLHAALQLFSNHSIGS